MMTPRKHGLGLGKPPARPWPAHRRVRLSRVHCTYVIIQRIYAPYRFLDAVHVAAHASRRSGARDGRDATRARPLEHDPVSHHAESARAERDREAALGTARAGAKARASRQAQGLSEALGGTDGDSSRQSRWSSVARDLEETADGRAMHSSRSKFVTPEVRLRGRNVDGGRL